MSTRLSQPPPTLRGRWLLLARVAWVALATTVLGLNVVGLPYSYAKYESACTTAACAHSEGTTTRLTPEGMRVLREFGLSPEFYGAYVGVVAPVIAVLVFAAVAGVIIWHRSDDRMALFSAFALLLFGGAALNSDDFGAAAAYPALWLPIHILEYAGQVAYTTFFYVFPDGRFVPRWARWLVVVWAVLLVPDVFFPRSSWNLLDGPLFFGLIGGAVLAQVYRYLRASTPVHRQQTKWVVFGIVVGGAGLVGTMTLVSAVPVIEQSGPLGQMIGSTLSEGFVLLIPLAIGVAMVRSGLYEIDIIINRTLVYSSLTLMLALVYFGCVTATQALFRTLTGQQELPQLVVVASTLVIAALFNPLRRHIQSFIDRSFYRSKYDARKTLEGFSMRLRDETDLEALKGDLLGVVRETMQPAHVSVWLRPDTSLKRERGA